MTNTKIFLFWGTSLSFLPQILNAAECAVTDCYLLGYTDSACPESGLKCPFGDGWYCGGSAAEDCLKLGYTKTCNGVGEIGQGNTCNGKYQSCVCDSTYKYTCSGTGYSGGSGSACGGKYTKCICKSPYTWTSGRCSCPSTYKYTCSGTGYSGGGGTSCGGKYTQCTCKSPYTWTSGACQCPAKYKYTCSGTGYAKGSGTACGGKYTACSCASDYEWKEGECLLAYKGEAIGDLYYCNGVVVGVKAPKMDFYVALHDFEYLTWASADSKCSRYSFCGSITGTLPTKDQLLMMHDNRGYIENLLTKNGGDRFVYDDGYWSSTFDSHRNDRDYYKIVSVGKGWVGNDLDTEGKTYSRSVLVKY